MWVLCKYQRTPRLVDWYTVREQLKCTISVTRTAGLRIVHADTATEASGTMGMSSGHQFPSYQPLDANETIDLQMTWLQTRPSVLTMLTFGFGVPCNEKNQKTYRSRGAVSKGATFDFLADGRTERKTVIKCTYIYSGGIYFFVIPFYLQSVHAQSANCVKM
jgi:hypothetical protein